MDIFFIPSSSIKMTICIGMYICFPCFLFIFLLTLLYIQKNNLLEVKLFIHKRLTKKEASLADLLFSGIKLRYLQIGGSL